MKNSILVLHSTRIRNMITIVRIYGAKVWMDGKSKERNGIPTHTKHIWLAVIIILEVICGGFLGGYIEKSLWVIGLDI